MRRTSRIVIRRSRFVLAASAVCLVTVTSFAVGQPADAVGSRTRAADSAQITKLLIGYHVHGGSKIAKTGSGLKLGPSSLGVTLTSDAALTGKLTLPPTSTTFKLIGFIPVTATVNLSEIGSITGRLALSPLVHVTAAAQYGLRLSNVKVGGQKTDVGNHCQTIKPLKIDLATAPGDTFNVVNGGTLVGKYTIDDFANCGLLTTPLINQLVPGSGNTISLTLDTTSIVGA